MRQERNRKTKIALTQKQKMHAMKLFHVLGGVVSRKELEKVAFKAHGLGTALSSAQRQQETSESWWNAAPAKQMQRAQSAAHGLLRVQENTHPDPQDASIRNMRRIMMRRRERRVGGGM